jgi:O-antigen ligase
MSLEPAGLRLSAYIWGLQILSVYAALASSKSGVAAMGVTTVVLTLIYSAYCGYLLAIYLVRQRKLRGMRSTVSPNHFGIAALLGILFLAWSGLSLLWTPAPASSVGYYLSYVVQALISYMLCRLYPLRDVFRNVFKGTAYAAAISTLLALVLTDYSGGRLGTELGSFGTIATSACLGIMAVLYLRLNRDIEKGIAIIFVISMLLALYLTFGKTEIIALAVAGVVYVLCAPGTWRRRSIRISRMALGVALALIVLSPKIASYQSLGGGATAETLTGRTVLWGLTYKQIASGPFIRGFGILALREMGPNPFSGTVHVAHAHDEFLQLWFNFGLVGVALVFGSYFALAYASVKTLKQRGGSAAILVLCAVVWCLVKGITEGSPAFCILPIPWLLLFDCLISTKRAGADKDFHRRESFIGYDQGCAG